MRVALTVTCLLALIVCSVSGAFAHLTGVKICVDPGHGGSDPGAVAFGTNEKDVNLDIGLRMRDMLQADNASVLMTRSTDIYVTLQGRCDVANNWGASRFECSHCNAFNGLANGTETYCSPTGAPEAFDLRNKVNAEMVAHMQTVNRGGKTNTFYVLENTNMPAILCEVAFLDNAADYAKLMDPGYRNEATRAYLHGTQSHYGIAPHDPVVDTEPPSVPTNLTANAVSSSRVDLAWTASTDNIGVAGYKIFRNAAQVGTSATNSYSDTTCSPNTSYTYEVSAYDAAGNESARSAPATATTPSDTTPPVISGVTATPSKTTATVTWSTNEAATSQVEYGLTTSYGTLTTLDPTLVTSHTVNLSGLVRRTTYHYRVRSRDAVGNEGISGDYTFKTK